MRLRVRSELLVCRKRLTTARVLTTIRFRPGRRMRCAKMFTQLVMFREGRVAVYFGALFTGEEATPLIPEMI